VNGRQTYTAPRLTVHGRVDEITLGDHLDLGVHAFQMAAAFSTSVIGQPTAAPAGSEVTQGAAPGGTTGGGGGGGGVLDTVPSDGVGVAPSGETETLANPGGTEGVGSSGGSGSGATTPVAAEGGRLPFTGMAVALVAGVGAAAVSGGAVLRRVTGRKATERV
jgi:hypothetical protein